METPSFRGVPPVISPPPLVPALADPAKPKGGAAMLYAIVALKLFTGVVLLIGAFAVQNMAGVDLQEAFTRLAQQANLDVHGKLFGQVERALQSLSHDNVRMFATGTVLYSILSIVEGIGLLFRASWAGWMAIAESAIFIPIELYKMLQNFTLSLAAILVLNIVIVWYLWAYRHRLFRHRH